MQIRTVVSEQTPTSAGSSRQFKPFRMTMNLVFMQSYRQLVPKQWISLNFIYASVEITHKAIKASA